MADLQSAALATWLRRRQMPAQQSIVESNCWAAVNSLRQKQRGFAALPKLLLGEAFHRWSRCYIGKFALQ
jgi:hypothetical protein